MQTDVVNPHSSPSLHCFSAIVACVAYILMLALLINALIYTTKISKSFGNNTDTQLAFNTNESIELAEVLNENTEVNTPDKDESLLEQKEITPEKIEETKEADTTSNQPKTIASPEIAKTKSTQEPKEQAEVKPEPNLADIFSVVSSQTIQDKRAIEKEKQKKLREEELARLEQEQKEKTKQLAESAAAIQQSTKALQQATRSLQDNVKQAMQTKINIEKPKFAGSPDDREKYEKWYDEIEQILMEEWKKNKFYYQSSTRAVVRIKVSAGGRLSYLYMIKQSPFGEYNSAAINFLHNMENKLFPPPPRDDIELTVNLDSTLRY